jgi:hypothetical protein
MLLWISLLPHGRRSAAQIGSRSFRLASATTSSTTTAALAIHLFPPILGTSGIRFRNVAHAILAAVRLARAIAVANAILDPTSARHLFYVWLGHGCRNLHGSGLRTQCNERRCCRAKRAHRQLSAFHDVAPGAVREDRKIIISIWPCNKVLHEVSKQVVMLDNRVLGSHSASSKSVAGADPGKTRRRGRA